MSRPSKLRVLNTRKVTPVSVSEDVETPDDRRSQSVAEPEITILKPESVPNLSFTFSLEKGGFQITGGCTARLSGLLFFPRAADKCSFALALPTPVAWIQQADETLGRLVRESGHKVVTSPKLRSWDGAPGIFLINFRGDDFPFMETTGEIKTFSTSTEVAHGIPVALLVRPGRSTTTSKDKEGKTMLGWPLFIQGIRVIPNPPEDLLLLKNSTKPQMAFPSLDGLEA